MGQVPDKLSPLLLQGHPENPIPSEQWQGGRKRHISPWGLASRAATTDETLCQDSSSARGDSKGQPAKVLAPLQAQPQAQLHTAQGTAQPPGHSVPTRLPRDRDLTAH